MAEQVKKDNELDSCQHPELYGQPKEKQTPWGAHPAMVQKMVADEQKMKEGGLNRLQTANGNSQVPASAVNRTFASPPAPDPNKLPVTVPVASPQIAAIHWPRTAALTRPVRSHNLVDGWGFRFVAR